MSNQINKINQKIQSNHKVKVIAHQSIKVFKAMQRVLVILMLENYHGVIFRDNVLKMTLH